MGGHSVTPTIFLARMYNLNLIIRKYKTKLRDNLQNKWPVFFKSVKVMKIKERLRNDWKKQKSHKTRSNAWFMTESFTHRGNYGTTGETCMGLWSGWWWRIGAKLLIWGYVGDSHCLWEIHSKVFWGNWTSGYLLSNGLGRSVFTVFINFFLSLGLFRKLLKGSWRENVSLVNQNAESFCFDCN